jgi:glycosyltransferase involved in cell wall biosynthesis
MPGEEIMPAREKISAVIITFNEEKKIERCLKSLTWAEEIVVVDSFSTDSTVEICRRYTDKVFQHPWPHSSSEQRNIADRYASNDWIIAIDADEVVTTGLRDEILEMFERGPRHDLYMLPRKEYFAGRWIEAGGWYPQYKTNFYRKSLGTWVGPIHLKVITKGTIGYLKHPILHDGYVSYKAFMDKFNYYSSIEAEADFVREHRRFSLLRALFKPVERFFGRFVRHRGYRDGIHGLFMAAVIAINYFLRELKIYEHQYRKKHRDEWERIYRESAVGGKD